MNLGLKGKNVIVTASSTGIGKTIAECFAAEGANLALCSRSKNKLIAAANGIKSKFEVDVFWSVCDINSLSEIESFYNSAVYKFGKIDILVNNCGGPAAGYFANLPEEKWDEAYKQVLLSVIRFNRLVLPDMITNQWGRIINITSISVKQPIENLILSNTFRAAVTSLTKTLSNEYAHNNITFNNVAPGYILTHRLYELAVSRSRETGKSHEEILIQMSKDVPMKRLGTPEEIAAVVVFLASKHASYITGTTIQVDGGLTKFVF